MFYIIALAKTYDGDINVTVWNYKEREFCVDYDAAYDKADGFGYSTRKYANKVFKTVEANYLPHSQMFIVDRKELFEYLDVLDWRNP